MPLIRNGSTLLRASSGEIAGTLACCCDEDPCPPCCSRIITGALIDGEILLYQLGGGGYALEGEIVTTSGTRVVCEDDEITITFRPDPDSGETSPGAFASWDICWKYVSHSPAVDPTDGEQDNLGYVEWGPVIDTVTNVGPQQEYSITLRYTPCYNKEYPGRGLIQIGFHNLDVEEDIVVAECPNQECCEIPGECDPCCWLLLHGVTNEDDNTFEFYAPLLGGTGTSFYMIVSVTLPDFGQKRACLESEIQVKVSIGARNHADVINNGQGMDFDVEIEIQGLGYNSAIPVDPDTEPVFLTPGSVIWLNRSVREYTAIASALCNPFLVPGGFVVSVQDNNSGAGATIPITFEECENDTDCECCCRKWCQQGCYFPVDPRACDYDPIEEPDGPWTKIENLELTIVASENVWNPILDEFGEEVLDEDGNPTYTCDTYRIAQTGPSIHSIACDVCGCPRSNGLFSVPWQIDFCGELFGGVVATNIFRSPYDSVNDPYGLGDVGHFWVLGPLGNQLAGLWFPPPETIDAYEITDTCTRATVSYSYVVDGITYTVNGSFDVVTSEGSSGGEIEACVSTNETETGPMDEFI